MFGTTFVYLSNYVFILFFVHTPLSIGALMAAWADANQSLAGAGTDLVGCFSLQDAAGASNATGGWWAANLTDAGGGANATAGGCSSVMEKAGP
jgi:hypothetical protein